MVTRPIVIAHRGASGYLPEHTAEAKALAYAQGADYLEQDVVATRDGALLVLHDLFLERVTDVALRYPKRCRDDGHYYAIDFTLEEVRTLHVSERLEPNLERPLYTGRFPQGLGNFRISTLGEEIELVQGLNASTGRRVGIYPEIKEPRWHARHGIDLSRSVLEELDRRGYRGPGDPVFVQCFDSEELERIKRELGTSLRLVQLVDSNPARAGLLEPEKLATIAEYSAAIGVPWRQTLDAQTTGGLRPSGALAAAHDAGLLVHAYTFRREQLIAPATSLPDMLRRYLGAVRLDGLFCDFPDAAVTVCDELFGVEH